MPYRDCWPEMQPRSEGWIGRVLKTAAPVVVESALFPLTRHGFVEEAWFTFTFTALRDDDGAVAGLLQQLVEVTSNVIQSRRALTLRRLSAESDTMAEATEVLAADAEDLPFAVVFEWQPRTESFEIVGSFGLEGLSMSRVKEAFGDVVREAMRGGDPIQVHDVERRLGMAHRGSWPEATTSAFVMPLRRPFPGFARAVSVFGLSPRLRFDQSYRAFVESTAANFGSILAAARASEIERELVEREMAARRKADLQREHLYSLLMQAPTPMCVVRGTDFAIELVNPSACQLWKRDQTRLIQQPLFAVVPGWRNQGFGEVLAGVARTGESQVRREIRSDVFDLDGTRREICLDFVCAPLRDIDQEIDGILLIGFDVTEQVRAREQIEELKDRAETASRAKDEFLAMLGHELRNPLAPIITALEVLRLRGNESLAREREILERQARHLMRLVDDLLDVSRITRGQVALKRERVELAEIVNRAIEMASPLLEERRHELVVDVPTCGVELNVDPVRFAQIFANLLTNAAKYTDQGGRIAIGAACRDGRVHVSVRDNGVGIEAEVLPHVFDMFLQRPQSIDRSHGGLGLGLTIVRNLVELHEGRIEARSAGSGRGSEFVMDFPAIAGPRRPRANPTPPVHAELRGARASCRVLVVDDNQDAADTLAIGLQSLGHTTCVAHDGPSALRVVAQFCPDTAVLDIGLPVMDGYELGRRLRSDPTLTDVVLIAVTGYGQTNDRARSRAAGFDAHLVKPVDLRHLDSCIRALRGRNGQNLVVE